MPAGVKKSTRGRASNYVRYICLVRDDVSAGRSLDRAGKAVLNSLVQDQLERLGVEAAKLALARDRITVGCRELATAVRLLLPEELREESLSEGKRACEVYARSMRAAAASN